MHWLGRYCRKAGYNFDVRHIEEIKNSLKVGTFRPPFHGDIESPRLLNDIDFYWRAFDLQPAECTLYRTPQRPSQRNLAIIERPAPFGPRVQIHTSEETVNFTPFSIGRQR